MAPQLSSFLFGDLTFEKELKSHGRHLKAAMVPGIEVQTLPMTVTKIRHDTEGGGGVFLKPDPSDLAKIVELEDMIKGKGSEKCKFRTCVIDGNFEAWMTPDTLLFNHHKQPVPLSTLKAGDDVKLGLSIDAITFASKEYGNLWNVKQALLIHKPEYMFDDEQCDQELAETL